MPEIDWGEARRYLGIHGKPSVPDEQAEQRMRQCGDELTRTVRPRAVWKRFPLYRTGNSLQLAGLEIQSVQLSKHLEGCAETALFAATLGVEADRLIRRAGISRMSDAVLLQACTASLLESWCDECCAQIAAEALPDGLYPRSRFSPGYGDFPIGHQRELLQILDAPKNIGLTVTSGMMLAPVKSVTAVVGLSQQPEGCAASDKCRNCGRRQCAFRKEGE